jgi:hypothetical protein
MHKPINSYVLSMKGPVKRATDGEQGNSSKMISRRRSPSNKENMNPNVGENSRNGTILSNKGESKQILAWGFGPKMPEKCMSPQRCGSGEKVKKVSNKLLQIYLRNKSKSPNTSQKRLFLGQSMESVSKQNNEKQKQRISVEKRDGFLKKYYSDYLRNKLSKKLVSENRKSQFLNKVSSQNIQIPIEFSKIRKSSYMDTDYSTNITSLRNSEQFIANDMGSFSKHPIAKNCFKHEKDRHNAKTSNSYLFKRKLAQKLAQIDESKLSKFYKQISSHPKDQQSEENKGKRHLNDMIRSCFNLSRITTEGLDHQKIKIEGKKSKRSLALNSSTKPASKSAEPRNRKLQVLDKQLVSKLSKLKTTETPANGAQKAVKTAEKGVQVDEWMVYNADAVKEANLIVNLDRMRGLMQQEVMERLSSDDDPETFFREIC